MSIWGKVAGAAAGAAIGGPIGALLGAVAGHVLLDREGRRARDSDRSEERGERRFRERDEIAFTIGVIALAAKLAKADGTVTHDEVEVFKRVFPVPREEEANVGHLFNLAKQDVAGFDSYAKQLASLFRGRPGVLEDLLDSLFLIAKADDRLHPGELEYLRNVAQIFGFSEGEFQRIRASHFGPDREDPYVILGVERSISNDDLKRAYHKLVRENHPDSLIARGVPAEFVKLATDKLAAINGAYEQVQKERGDTGLTEVEQDSAAAQTLGKKVLATDRERGYIKASFVAGDNFINRGGRVFGGFLAAMLDTLCGHATRLTHREPGTPQVTLELKTSFIGRADAGILIGEGWVRHRGKSIAFAEAELRNEAGELVAKGSATLKVGK